MHNKTPFDILYFSAVEFPVKDQVYQGSTSTIPFSPCSNVNIKYCVPVLKVFRC